jgi:oligoendopeptidase F
LRFRSGNPKPCIGPDGILAHGRRFYHELSPETAQFIDVMLDDGLMDVLSRPGKAGGGYSDSLPAYSVPFIFANFNGTSDDVETITHEAGHAFAGWLGRDIVPMEAVSRRWRPARCIPCPWNSSPGHGRTDFSAATRANSIMRICRVR